MIFWS